MGAYKNNTRKAYAAHFLRRTLMADKTIKKIDSSHSPHGEMGQKYLASGVSVAMRLW